MKQAFLTISITLLIGLIVQRAWSTTPTDVSKWIGKEAPELARGEWINSPPLSLKNLRGKVVLLEFWTFGCYNCQNTLPHIKEWHRKYSGAEFAIVGIHTPEFDREKDLQVVKREMARLGILYPVVTDDDYRTWDRYNQQYWPVVYLLDRQGIIRYVHVGEGNYEETERRITSLIMEKRSLSDR